MLNWLGRKVGVYGYGKTGKACVDYLAPRLIRPVVFVDETDPQKLAALQAQAGDSCQIIGADGIAAEITGLDSLVLSPGVPLSNPNVIAAREAGVQLVGELELAARYCQGYILAITGTNGKSTTTKLLGHILEGLGRTHVLGNIGTPLLASLDEIESGDYVALEVSSFQLETVDRFKPHVAIYTNLTPDHMDRHGSMEEYARVKRLMAQRMGSSDFVVTNARESWFAPESFANQQPTYLLYSAEQGAVARGAWVEGGRICVNLGAEQHELPLECIKLPGVHNVENALAALTAAMLVGADASTVAERLSTFTGYEHRLELCRSAGALRFYNDSKATNPEATITALKAMSGHLVLILGGRDKLTPLDEMLALVQQKVQYVLLIGEATERFAAALDAVGYNAYQRVGDMEHAVAASTGLLGSSGGSVLLSPACASFDQYSSYEQRGEHFKELVAALSL
ncbi:UDP-N-acetylmuramoyl-L-alanine--D-glutamate ligase [bacterium]|nr:UDP-N-acetylmuramoyl-L-alanine--D-glutamate ligase [bacterium]